MTESEKLKKEKARWIEKYNELAEKINMPEYSWVSGNLETIKKRYAKLYIHHTETKHIDKPVDWIIKKEEENISLEDISLEDIKNYGNRADIISDYYDFDSFWEAMGKNKFLGEINDLWNNFLYPNFDLKGTTLSEYFEVWNRNR